MYHTHTNSSRANYASSSSLASIHALHYRDVGLTLNDIHGLSESNLEPGQAAVVETQLANQGHRMWAAHRTSRDSQKGTGTVIVARSTVAPTRGISHPKLLTYLLLLTT